MQDIFKVLEIDAPQEKVFEALSTVEGIRSWWTTDARAEQTVGNIVQFGLNNHTLVMQMKVLELTAPTKLVWECLDQPEDWRGSKITFTLAPEDTATTLTFSQTNWKTEGDSAPYATQWEGYLNSLRAHLETGTGTPQY